ncbi:MAG: prepilin-type N-terminal cleavage/methylation domain-containing protein [candidate division Zixibacteria bacterium]|nr:prepilin-type N-terminal cleavage/methylation domain-containing protein [candidate division Zixibacteria bacterium]
MRKLSKEKGFTLIELLIASGMSVIIVGAALSAYLAQHKHYVAQTQVTDMQANIRGSLQELATKVRMAGYNVPRGIQAITAYNTNPDSLEIIYDSGLLDDVQLKQDMPDESSELRCDGHDDDLSPVQEGDWLYIYDPNTQTGEFFQVSRIIYAPARIQHSTTPLSKAYPVGSSVLKLNRTKYFIDNISDAEHSNLVVSEMGGNPEIYADNITDVQFSYVLSSGAVVDIPPLPQMVRMVVITIDAVTERPESEYATTFRNRSRQLQTTVKVRNLGLN